MSTSNSEYNNVFESEQFKLHFGEKKCINLPSDAAEVELAKSANKQFSRVLRPDLPFEMIKKKKKHLKKYLKNRQKKSSIFSPNINSWRIDSSSVKAQRISSRT